MRGKGETTAERKRLGVRAAAFHGISLLSLLRFFCAGQSYGTFMHVQDYAHPDHSASLTTNLINPPMLGYCFGHGIANVITDLFCFLFDHGPKKVTDSIIRDEQKGRLEAFTDAAGNYNWVVDIADAKLLDDTILASLFPRGVFSDKLKSPCNHKEAEDREKVHRLHKDRKISDWLQFTGTSTTEMHGLIVHLHPSSSCVLITQHTSVTNNQETLGSTAFLCCSPPRGGDPKSTAG